MIKKKPTILLLISSIAGAGAELVVANLCRYIDKTKFRTICCHLKGIGERGEDLSRDGFEIVGLFDNKKAHKYLGFYELKRMVRDENIDIINSHNSEPLIEAALCKLITPRVKMLHTFHFGNYPHINKKLYYAEKILSRIPDKCIAVGYEQRKKIIQHLNVKENNIITIYNGVDNKSHLNLECNVFTKRPGKITIGAISTFTEQKALDQLLFLAKEAQEKKLNCHFVIAGDGPKYQELMVLGQELGLRGTVEFLGWIKNAADIVLPNVDVFIQTSLWEAMSTAVLEAMSYGKPLIVTDVGENKKIITEAQAGYVLPSDNIGAMIDKIEILTKNKGLRTTFGRNAKNAYDKNYKVENMVKNYEELFLKTLKLNLTQNEVKYHQ